MQDNDGNRVGHLTGKTRFYNTKLLLELQRIHMYNDFDFQSIKSDALRIVYSFIALSHFQSTISRVFQIFVILSSIFLLLNHLTKYIIEKYPLIEVEHKLGIRVDIASDLEHSIISDQQVERILTPKLSFERFPSLNNSTTTSPAKRTSDIDSESRDILTYLDHKTFYKNLNNSSQYLRRDSFSQ